MKKRKYVDLFGYTAEEFDNWLETSTNKKLRSTGKPKSELDRQTVFGAYKDETRELSRRRLRKMRAGEMSGNVRRISGSTNRSTPQTEGSSL